MQYEDIIATFHILFDEDYDVVTIEEDVEENKIRWVRMNRNFINFHINAPLLIAMPPEYVMVILLSIKRKMAGKDLDIEALNDEIHEWLEDYKKSLAQAVSE